MVEEGSGSAQKAQYSKGWLMKITNRIISIPPYISTSWRNIHSIHMTDGIMIVTLSGGEAVYVPDLKLTEIELIFKAHQAYLEHEEPEQHSEAAKQPSGNPLSALLQSLLSPDASGAPVRMAFSSLENLGTMLQHNPAQANAPSLPAEVLEKVSSIAKWMAVEDTQSLPKAEPHCNCFHCQIARALSGDAEVSHVVHEHEPKIDDTELQFQQWDIQQTGDNLYRVSNRLDAREHYSVFLGNPMGCTCGKQGCEHIVAVLQS